MRKIIKKIKMKKENIMVVLSGAVFMTVMDVTQGRMEGDHQWIMILKKEQ